MADDVIFQDEPIPEEIFEKYAGQTVALRGREVVAAAANLEELRANPRVRLDDVVFAVPAGPTLYWELSTSPSRTR